MSQHKRFEVKEIKLAIIAAALCAVSACSTYTEATAPNGASIKRIAIAPGTSITTQHGCINNAGGTCSQ